MFYNEEEYADEIDALRARAETNSCRMNLRIGIVKDKDLINRLKIKYPNWFPTDHLSKSTMVLKRYDGTTHVANLATMDVTQYSWWINKNSKKPIDALQNGAYQLSDLVSLTQVILFVSFDKSDPKQYKRCTDAI